MYYDMSDVSLVCKAWEDNAGTENLANIKGPLMNRQTKHIGMKYHWFIPRIKAKEIEVLRIDTKQQKANMFTKGVTKFNFEQIRKLV